MLPTVGDFERLREDYKDAQATPEIIPTASQHTIREELCEICSSIPWKELMARVPFDTLATFDKTKMELSKSPCRICRLLASDIAAFEEDAFYTSPPYELELVYNVSIDHKDIFWLCVREKDGPSRMISQGLYIRIVQQQSSQEETTSGPLMLGDTPIELIKTLILECKQEHGAECAPNGLYALQGLKIIDCERREVVYASQGCQFVALSYVWGQGSTDLDDKLPFSEKRLPKTVSDSLLIARELGYRYLWVDRYCIDQGNHQERDDQVAQMADIYAVAQLTLIAAAGNDASHGLLDIQMGPMHVLYQEPGLSMQLLPRPTPFQWEDLRRSRWASRAWTFQECYFTRRRSFFTNHQVIYICNDASSDSDYLSDWIPSLHLFSHDLDRLLKPEAMSHALEILSAYTGRRLTYDSDALAAIVGALNALGTKALQHAWGLPYRSPSMCSGQGNWGPDAELALFWHHSEPCSRRQNFPSWSPVAWTGSVQWYTSPSSHSPITASTIGIRLVSDPTGTTISQVASTADSKFESQSQYLEITAKMGQFRIVKVPLPSGDDTILLDQAEHRKCSQDILLALPLDDEIDIILPRPRWDRTSSELREEEQIYGILFHEVLNEDFTPIRLKVPIIMLVRQHGNCYERIGSFRLYADFEDTFSEVNMLHKGGYLKFRRRSTGEIYNVDYVEYITQGYKHGKCFDELVLLTNFEFTWEELFVEDTIILG